MDSDASDAGSAAPTRSAAHPARGSSPSSHGVAHPVTPGVLYISRIPPALKPRDLRRLLEPLGTLGRVFIQPESEAARKERVQRGGSRRKRFTEGWVEFADRRAARRAAALLQGTAMDARNKRSRFHADLWCLRYVPGLQWHHLTDELAAQRRARLLRTKNEARRARQERDFWLEQVDAGRAVDHMVARRRAQRDGKEGNRMRVEGRDEGMPRLAQQRRVLMREEREPSTDTAQADWLRQLVLPSRK
ncbi:hypothetical protein CDCA_CDCA19G4707 [Cyanidium caldarium]|uniref:RRM domain-containing protein n=1 Tax=Cyanidium caldarium TaxID=2771 RepID=A0AAV9J253_CYACA|nr:hypothetical protein CDCA_CDCA19G4707 [Cyanidium caldarium]